jgi:stage II sporulation protein R
MKKRIMGFIRTEEEALFRLLNSEKKIIAAALCIGFAVTFGIMCVSAGIYSDKISGGISDKVIRFHVLANSDSAEDQALKLGLRNAILAEYGGRLCGIPDIGAARAFFSENLDEIKSFSEDFVLKNGYGYTVGVTIARDLFPTKSYGEFSFPAGSYEALRITIGEGKGKNFWCVMFPPLCLVDAVGPKTAAKAPVSLETALNAEEYGVVSGKNAEYRVKFKIVELWRRLFGR